MKDGTMAKIEELKSSSSPENSSIEHYFNKRPHLNKSRVAKNESVPEEIDESELEFIDNEPGLP
jgi:hypothetical protein